MAVIKKATLKSYDAQSHRATVQIAGSLGVWLPDVRVATNIPPADVVAGRQCSVLFLDPANQDDAVIVAVQGALPSVGAVLYAKATADLTLTTTAQSITGDGDSGKLRLLLPTPGDWIVEATVDFLGDATGYGAMVADLYINDSGTAVGPEAILAHAATAERATVSQAWKVTTTVANTPVELKARKTVNGGTATLKASHTTMAASGVQRSTGGGGVTDHGALTGLGDDDHPQYGALAQAETWAALQTFGAGLQLAAGQGIQDSGGAVRYQPSTTSPQNTLTGDVFIQGPARLGVNRAVGQAGVDVGHWLSTISGTVDGVRIFDAQTISIGSSFATVRGVMGQPQFTVGTGTTFHTIHGLRFSPVVLGGSGGGSVFELFGVMTTWLAMSWSGTITTAAGIRILSPSFSGAGTVSQGYGLHIQNQAPAAGIANATGLQIDDMTTTGTTRYLLNIGSATLPQVRVEAALPTNPGASKGRSRVLATFNENGTNALRRVEWKDYSTLAAGDKVLVAV